MSDYDDCWCEWVGIGVGMQRAAEIAGCPEHAPWTDESGALFQWGSVVGTGDEIMRQLIAEFRAMFHRPPCGCPTPTHRMSCGAEATPKVVSK